MKIQSTKYNRPIHQMWHMMAMTVMLLMLAVTPPIMAQEDQRALPDSMLHLPELNAYGQMQPAVSHWPVGYVGMDNWKLHKGMNLMLGASVFTSFGKGWKGAGFSQQLRGKNLGKRLFISQNMLRRQEMDFLDDITLEQAVEALDVPIYPIEQDGFGL